MRLIREYEVRRSNGVLAFGRKKQLDYYTRLPQPDRGWFSIVREPFMGAWSRVTPHVGTDPMAHPTWYSCVTLIAESISKIRPMLIQLKPNGTWQETTSPSFSPVLRKPNHYQTRIQFYQAWIISKLTHGNAYVLKERDNRGVVTDLYLLDPTRVQPLVAPNGDVYYALGHSILAGFEASMITVPARDIIHDRMVEMPGQPLIGISPLVAAGMPLIQAMRLTQNATTFAERGSMLSGVLLCPTPISSENQERIEQDWMDKTTNGIGRVIALDQGMTFEPLKMMSAIDAQLIDQLKWSDEKICETLHVPPSLVLGTSTSRPVPYTSSETLMLVFYTTCLQYHFEALEETLDYGLDLPDAYGIQFDVENLLRMDMNTRMSVATNGVKGSVFTPNEARLIFNKPPVAGGDAVYAQQQEFSLSALAERDAHGPLLPPAPGPPSGSPPGGAPSGTAPETSPSDVGDSATRDLDELCTKAFLAEATARGLLMAARV